MIPTILIPETVYFNTLKDLEKDHLAEFYFSFDLLPDITLDQLQSLKVYSVLNGLPSQETCEIEWRLDPSDLGWISNNIN